MKTIPEMLNDSAEKFAELPALRNKNEKSKFIPTSYAALRKESREISAALYELGLKDKEPVGLISENRKEWLLADLGVLCLGSPDVPRGCDTMAPGLIHILGKPECRISFFENEAQVKKLISIKDELPHLKIVISFDPLEEETLKALEGCFDYYLFSDLQVKGSQLLDDDPALHHKLEKIESSIDEEDLATIIFTSGTTGEPKGVMLTHHNYLYQSRVISENIGIGPEDDFLNILPVWHSFERVLQYVALYHGATLAYSKPIGKILLLDIQAVTPTIVPAVPRIWDALMAGITRNIEAKGPVVTGLFNFFFTLSLWHEKANRLLKNLNPQYGIRIPLLGQLVAILPWLVLFPFRGLGELIVFRKIKRKMFTRFRIGISGGGAMPRLVDDFFSALNIKILEGYGLTETGPVISVRKEKHPVVHTVGPVLAGTEVQVRSKEGDVLSYGERGVLFCRGEQNMKGYYKNQEATVVIRDKEGWIDTGDIAIVTKQGEVAIVGRAKDTIVLLGGENIEPVPIEAKAQESPFIETCLVVGQDKKMLSALIVPDFDALEKFAKENSVAFVNRKHLGDVVEIQELIHSEISDLISARNGFKSFERISRIRILGNHFEVGQELSAKMELLRPFIYKKYKKEIAQLLGI